jgi:hypothetical protein
MFNKYEVVSFLKWSGISFQLKSVKKFLELRLYKVGVELSNEYQLFDFLVFLGNNDIEYSLDPTIGKEKEVSVLFPFYWFPK